MVDAEWLASEMEGGYELSVAQLRVTLLAAGFVIGASGASVRELSQKTNTMIQSWTDKDANQHFNNSRSVDQRHNPTRVFRIKGVANDVALAAEIIKEAVVRYNDLCENKKRGEFVRRQQKVRDVEFSYQPPPKTAGGGGGGQIRENGMQRNGSQQKLNGHHGGMNARAPMFLPPHQHVDNSLLAQAQLLQYNAQLATQAYQAGTGGFAGTGVMSGGMPGAIPYHANTLGQAMFSLPVGTDPSVVAAAAQAAAQAANRAATMGQFAQPEGEMGVGAGGVIAGRGTSGMAVSGTQYHQPQQRQTRQLPSNPSFDRLWATAQGEWDAQGGNQMQSHGTNAIPS